MFAYHQQTGPIDLAFTDRHDGVSGGAWSSLNLGTSNGDDPDRVATNLGAAAEAFDVPAARVVRMSQFHGRDVAVVDARTPSGPVPVADALVTADPGVALLVRVADCTPVVLADAAAGVVGVVHAGRPGMVIDVAGAAVEQMRALGATSIEGWLGPRACGACYEVPEQMRDEVAAVEPTSWSTTSWGTPALDVAAGVRAQLERRDVRVTDLADTSSMCTMEDERFFSYRRQGQQSGRLGALVRVRA
ncbi:polyphenol oxidase family protein [Solicola sp. PLA-1-18]|uniref:polyphenol oxidase family protein n=1 Tax=Solicola sp. PLA-1-18 TaxID=3380532 RepID=UPI003B810687